MADVNVTPITELELSQILSGKVDSILIPPEKIDDTIKDDKDDKSDINWTDMANPQEIKDEDKEVKDDKPTEPVKVGRPPSFVNLINEMIESKELFGFQDGDVKTIDEAKELIRLNIEEIKKSKVDDTFDDKIKSYSPQIQAIIQYAENGGQDVTSLMSAITEYEKTSTFNVETEKGQEDVLREYYKVQGFDDDYIKEEIETLKDVNKLKDRAAKLLPKLEQLSQERLALIMQEQEREQLAVQAARESYKKTIHSTLSKETLGDFKLQKQEKNLLWDAVTEDKYFSWDGSRTNRFFKKIEELQAGDKADYDHFLQLVYFAIDRDGFKEKFSEKLKTDQTVTTVRKLKMANDRSNSSDESFEDKSNKQVNLSGRFKRPISF